MYCREPQQPPQFLVSYHSHPIAQFLVYYHRHPHRHSSLCTATATPIATVLSVLPPPPRSLQTISVALHCRSAAEIHVSCLDVATSLSYSVLLPCQHLQASFARLCKTRRWPHSLSRPPHDRHSHASQTRLPHPHCCMLPLAPVHHLLSLPYAAPPCRAAVP